MKIYVCFEFRKSGYGDLEGPWNSKPSKIQTFFQISVTALAFLAFAGYLLCMIVQAIKSKGRVTKLIIRAINFYSSHTPRHNLSHDKLKLANARFSNWLCATSKAKATNQYWAQTKTQCSPLVRQPK